MDTFQIEKIAIFRYGVIAPYISTNGEGYKTPSDFFRAAAGKTYQDPVTGKDRNYTEYTIYRWYKYYQKDGFDGLKPQPREDAGKPRKLDDDIKARIMYYRKNYPRIPSTVIYEKLIEEGIITNKDVSLSTITRYNNLLKAEMRQTNNKDMRRYERMHINEVWCGDTCYGPYIKVNGVKKRVYFIALLDDASRMITGIKAFYSDNFINLMDVIKSAISKFGIPSTFNFDNGSNFRSHQMELLAGRIGTYLNYNPPYTPEGKAKQERFWRTLKDHWMCTLHLDDFHNLDSVNESLQSYINQYNNTVHSSLNGKTPHERFFEESQLIRYMNEDKFESCFMLEESRKVSIDNVIELNNIQYEVPYRYSNQRITVRYMPGNLDVYVIDNMTGEKELIHLLDKHANANIKRESFRFSEVDEQ